MSKSLSLFLSSFLSSPLLSLSLSLYYLTSSLFRSPAIMRINVVFPVPFSPNITTISESVKDPPFREERGMDDRLKGR
jgi:hypothetical protein